MKEVTRALSRIPTVNTQVQSSTMITAGRLMMPPSSPPGGVIAQCGRLMPPSSSSFAKYPDQPMATAMLATPYSRIRFQPVIQATNSPSVA